MARTYIKHVYAALPETQLYRSASRSRKQRKFLMGTWMGVIENTNPDFYKIYSFGEESYVLKSEVVDNYGMKAFFIDVGQGDATLVEAGGKTVLVDGGPGNNLCRYLCGYKYKWILRKGLKVNIDAIVVSHFDYDHYNGLISIIKDDRFNIGAIYHNGIARFHEDLPERDPKYDSDLGETDFVDGVQDRTILKTTFDDIDDCRRLLADIPAGKKGLAFTFKKFIQACVDAHQQGRLGKLQRVTNRDNYLPGYGASNDFSIEVLGPVPTRQSGRYQFEWLDDSSHTRNGHSVLIKLDYKGKSLLLGGDLNTASEDLLMYHYDNTNPFQVDVAKSCHHGSSDFSVDFMKKINPYATVISSGDNESYAHPRADSIGCAGRYARGERPKVFSTELARSYNSGGDIHYGLINMRTDGNQIVLAQMKEKRSQNDPWDSYVL